MVPATNTPKTIYRAEVRSWTETYTVATKKATRITVPSLVSLVGVSGVGVGGAGDCGFRDGGSIV